LRARNLFHRVKTRQARTKLTFVRHLRDEIEMAS